MTLWNAAHQASLSFTSFQSLLKLMSIESVMPSNHLILCCPLLLLHSVFPSIRVFSNDSTLCIRWPKYWSFSISPSNVYPGLMSFRFDPLSVQGTLKSLLQHHSSKASVYPAVVAAFQPYSLYVLESAMLLTVTGPSHTLFPLPKTHVLSLLYQSLLIYKVLDHWHFLGNLSWPCMPGHVLLVRTLCGS